MARAGNAIEHDAGDAHASAEIAQARGDGGGRLRLPCRIEHQEHRPAHHVCDIRAGAAAATARDGYAVEQAHRALGKHEVRVGPARNQRFDGVTRHRPAVEIDRAAPGRGGMEGGIDVIGPALEALHGKPAVAIGARKGQRHRGLAGARGRSGDDERARHHVVSGKRGAVPTGR